MTNTIHPSAELAEDIILGDGITISTGAVIGSGARIGDNCFVGPYVNISGDTTLGEGCQLFHSAVVGMVPQDLKYAGEHTRTILGDRVVVREFGTIHRGTKASGETRLGNDCLIMAYAHVAHDCSLGDHVILANACQLAGHITIGDWAIIGGLTAVQQFVRIGAHTYIGGMCRIIKDVLPFTIIADIPSFAVGINIEGLRRRGFDQQTRTALQQAFRIVYRLGLTPADAIAKLRVDFPQCPEVQILADFLAGAERGIMPGRKTRLSESE